MEQVSAVIRLFTTRHMAYYTLHNITIISLLLLSGRSTADHTSAGRLHMYTSNVIQ